ncbi:MAG: hypothetical protein KY468_01945 [Armatimonadetes bacterium]|nr:hypothetical protein [Armatimonadota bacterium]
MARRVRREAEGRKGEARRAKGQARSAAESEFLHGLSGPPERPPSPYQGYSGLPFPSIALRPRDLVLLSAVLCLALPGSLRAAEPPKEGDPPPPVPPGDVLPEVDPLPPDVPLPPPAGLPPSGDPATPVQPIPSPGASPRQPLPATPTPPLTPPSIPTPDVGPPTETETPAVPPEERGAPVNVKGDYVIHFRDTGIVRGRGTPTSPTVLTYRDVVMTANEMEANLNTRDVYAKGNVVVQSGNRTIRGDELTFNLRTRAWRLGGGRASILPRRLVSPIYVRGTEFSGQPHLIEGENGSFTTCDLPDPHYHIRGREISIVPERRAVIKRASLYYNNRRLITIPRLVIPLQRHQYNIVPRFGQNNVEGYFVKTAYYYPSSLGDNGVARVDLMSKKGIGLGVDQGYRFAKGTGQVVLYSVLGAGALQGREWNGSLRHQQQLGSFVASLQSEFRRNSYQFAPGSTNVSQMIDLTRRTTRGSLSFGYRSDRSGGAGVGGYDRQGFTYAQNQTWGRNSARVNLGLFDTQSFGNQEKELNTQINLDRRLPSYDLGLAFNMRNQLVSTAPGFLSGVERLPELTFATHRSRIKGGLFRYLPGGFGLSVGEFHEQPGNVQSMRVLLDLGIDNRRFKIGNSTLDVNGSFKQAVYQTDAAQYLVSANANWVTPFTRHNEFTVRYVLLSPEGYTPFRFDTLGKYHLVTGDFVHRERRFRAAVGTGRDLRGGQFAWHDARVRLQYSPSENFYLAAASSYDFNQGNWRDVVAESRMKFGLAFLNLGLRYTPLSGRVGSVRWNLFTPIGRKYSIQTLGGWNGFSRQYDYRLLRFNYEHHDFRASLSYVDQVGFQNQKGLRFMLHLRALPLQEEFAVGPFGQSLSTTEVGEIF